MPGFQTNRSRADCSPSHPACAATSASPLHPVLQHRFRDRHETTALLGPDLPNRRTRKKDEQRYKDNALHWTLLFAADETRREFLIESINGHRSGYRDSHQDRVTTVERRATGRNNRFNDKAL